nr:hypothetical protein [Tanacetum cinerariifolium]
TPQPAPPLHPPPLPLYHVQPSPTETTIYHRSPTMAAITSPPQQHHHHEHHPVTTISTPPLKWQWWWSDWRWCRGRRRVREGGTVDLIDRVVGIVFGFVGNSPQEKFSGSGSVVAGGGGRLAGGREWDRR